MRLRPLCWIVGLFVDDPLGWLNDVTTGLSQMEAMIDIRYHTLPREWTPLINFLLEADGRTPNTFPETLHRAVLNHISPQFPIETPRLCCKKSLVYLFPHIYSFSPPPTSLE